MGSNETNVSAARLSSRRIHETERESNERDYVSTGRSARGTDVARGPWRRGCAIVIDGSSNNARRR